MSVYSSFSRAVAHHPTLVTIWYIHFRSFFSSYFFISISHPNIGVLPLSLCGGDIRLCDSSSTHVIEIKVVSFYRCIFEYTSLSYGPTDTEPQTVRLPIIKSLGLSEIQLHYHIFKTDAEQAYNTICVLLTSYSHTQILINEFMWILFRILR